VTASLTAIAVLLAIYSKNKSNAWIQQVMSHSASGQEKHTKEFLLVTAHPDDESMFFIPVLMQLNQNVNWHLLCLSSGMIEFVLFGIYDNDYFDIVLGDFDGLGKERIAELQQCWKYLGFDENKLVVKEDPKLQVFSLVFFYDTKC